MLEKLRRNMSYFNAYLFANSGVQPNPEEQIICNSNQIRFYADTPNTIIYYDVNGNKGYFRECKKHTEPHDFVWQLIEEYCRYVFSSEHNEECERILKEKLSEPQNLNKFFNMGAGTAGYTRISKFRHSLDSSWVGIEEPYPEWFRSQLLALVQYAWGALDEYKYCRKERIGQYHTYNSNRTITTKRIVNLLGEPGIIPESKYIRLILDGDERIGVTVAVAEGQAPKVGEYDGITPEFQRQSLILNIADVICYQKDHRPGNYFVTTEGRMATGLCAFDNDCPTTLFNTPDISFTTYAGCSSILNENGLINRPFMDRESTNRLMELSKAEVFEAVSDSTSRVEREMLWQRIKRLQNAVKKSIDHGSLLLLKKSDWSSEAMQKELSGNYGMTYAKLFYEMYIVQQNRQ